MATEARPLRRASSCSNSPARRESSRARSSARPNCSVSRRPRRLSSTNEFIAPKPSRTSRPPLPAASDERNGATTPTSTYDVSASAPSTGESVAMNAAMPSDTASAMTAGESVWA